MTDRIQALSGKPVDGLTVEAVRAGEVGVADLRIHPETLERQAVVAEQHGDPQLAEPVRDLHAERLRRSVNRLIQSARLRVRQ